ncbi:MAG: ergothioneine biosynthesis protein EgtB [Sporichthyaceae bacterium]
MNGLRAAIAADLERARGRTRALTDALDDADLTRQHSPLMSPLVWDLAHIGNQEELWLLRELTGHTPILPPRLDQLYDAFRHARKDRPALPLLDPDQARSYVHDVRARVLTALESVALDERTELTRDGFVFRMVAQHEQQHVETMYATHQLRCGPAVLAAPSPPLSRRDVPAEVLVPAGHFEMGTDLDPWALDNERPAHQVHVPAFHLDTTPVTNAAYADFIADGGYRNPRWWQRDGWAHLQDTGWSAPEYWSPDGGGGWVIRRFGTTAPMVGTEPVQHVCWFEADAYARWAGRRLPSEIEWEKAARFDPVTGRSLRYPWGDGDPTPELANLAGRHLGPAPVGAYPAGSSPLGAHQMIGDVWEWTSSDFTAYPGFRAFPYPEYSQVFFPGPGRAGEYKVLRGGSWAVDHLAARGTFRNWDYPIRRQIFAGFRTAREADGVGGCSGGGAPRGC